MAQEGTLIGARLGDYELRSLLGIGGMAEVYRARDRVLERDVAVKVLPATLARDAGYVERFRNEARQVAALNHPHIVPIYTFGDDGTGGLLYHVMPLLRESLRDRLSREGALPPDVAVDLVLQVASALEAAHAIGLVHRDVKPENVLLDADGQALLTDFGIARPLTALRQSGVARTLAATGLPVGTPEYMAPEQLRGESTDQRADVYALGAVLYELLTGRVPYDAETPYGVAALVISAPLVPPSAHNPRIWPALDRVVKRSLAKDPTVRYSDALSFGAALRDAMTRRGEDADDDDVTAPILALSAGSGGGVATGGAREWQTGIRANSPRRRRWALAAGLVALLLVGFAGGAALLLHGGGATGGNTSASGSALAGGTAQITGTAATAGTPTAMPSATPSATAAPSPTATAVPAPPGPTMTISPAQKLSLSQKYNSTCYGSQKMTNNGTSGQTLNWSWQVSPAPPTDSSGASTLHYSINSFPLPGVAGNPSQSNMAPGQETLWVSMPCNGQTYTVTLTYDGSGSPLTFDMQVP